MDRYQKRHSSIRCVPARTTLSLAKVWRNKAGISRVTNITHLDRIGLPVYAGIRPRAESDVVTYGKGLLPIDAQVGAYMEAIEFYFAEPSTKAVSVEWGNAKDIIGGDKRKDAILDFNPILNKQISFDDPILLAVAQNVYDKKECFVPAELVYHPAPPQLGQRLFGSSTNGLASGNSLLEASIHALIEVIERDIWSFEYINEAARMVLHTELPGNIRQVIERAAGLGVKFHVQYIPNHYGLAFFSVFLYEANNITAKFFNGGWGCHYDKEIALVRAVCEAAQSRLALIHGARELHRHANAIMPNGGLNKNFHSKADAMLAKPKKNILYSDIPDYPIDKSLARQWSCLLNCLQKVSDQPVCRVVYTPKQSPLQVVRIIVPTLEHFQLHHRRIGCRFKRAAAEIC